MEKLQKDLEKFEFVFTISGLIDLISQMAENGKTKIDLLNVSIEDIQKILLWCDFYYKVSELKYLKDTT